MQINIYDAKAKLSSLLDRAVAGEDIVIARAGKPLARLVALAGREARSGVRLGGLKGAKLKLSKGFHDPSTDKDLLVR